MVPPLGAKLNCFSRDLPLCNHNLYRGWAGHTYVLYFRPDMISCSLVWVHHLSRFSSLSLSLQASNLCRKTFEGPFEI